MDGRGTAQAEANPPGVRDDKRGVLQVPGKGLPVGRDGQALPVGEVTALIAAALVLTLAAPADTDYIGAFTAYAYCPCEKCCGQWAGGATASGTMPQEGRTVAADPDVLPLGTSIYISGMGWYTVEDTGAGVDGSTLDVYMDSHEKALQWGVKTVEVYRPSPEESEEATMTDKDLEIQRLRRQLESARRELELTRRELETLRQNTITHETARILLKGRDDRIAELEAQMENQPLTLEDLRQMDGEPVWINDFVWEKRDFWGIVSVFQRPITGKLFAYVLNGKRGVMTYPEQEYGKCWLAYRRKPEEATP